MATQLPQEQNSLSSIISKTLGAYADAARGLGAHLRDIDPYNNKTLSLKVSVQFGVS